MNRDMKERGQVIGINKALASSKCMCSGIYPMVEIRAPTDIGLALIEVHDYLF